MKSIFSYLVFDREIVEKIKTSKPSKDLLYTQLIGGKITLQEYVEMSR
jgi:hypothetical protein